MQVIFKRSDGTFKTIDVLPDSKLGESREAAQMLLGLPVNPPCKLVLERINRELEDSLTFEQAGVQNNDQLILLNVNEQNKTVIKPPPEVNDTPNRSSSQSPSSPNSNNWLPAIVTGSVAGIIIVATMATNTFNRSSNSDQPPNSNQPSSNTYQSPINSISREAAVNTVKQWLDYKRILLAPPYNKQPGADLLTGKAYRNNVDKSSEPCNGSPDDCLSSVDWLQKNNAQYSFGVQRIDSVDRFEASGDTGTIFVTVTEYRTLHKSNGQTTPSGGTKKARYDLQFENGKVKISDYKVLN